VQANQAAQEPKSLADINFKSQGKVTDARIKYLVHAQYSTGSICSIFESKKPVQNWGSKRLSLYFI
jgi:hypothetical protein